MHILLYKRSIFAVIEGIDYCIWTYVLAFPFSLVEESYCNMSCQEVVRNIGTYIGQYHKLNIPPKLWWITDRLILFEIPRCPLQFGLIHNSSSVLCIESVTINMGTSNSIFVIRYCMTNCRILGLPWMWLTVPKLHIVVKFKMSQLQIVATIYSEQGNYFQQCEILEPEKPS